MILASAYWLALVLAQGEPQGEPAPAVPAVPEVPEVADEAPPALTRMVTGYLESRNSYTQTRPEGLVSTADVPTWTHLTEANVQLRLAWREAGFVLGDASFFFQKAGRFFDTDASGHVVQVPDHDVPALRPLAVIHELYGSYNFGEHAHVTLGKKRIVWGPGLAFNPTDLINPPKDPTDPTFQRAGAWLLRAEFPFETFTLSLVGAAQTLRQYGGVPSGLLVYPGQPSREAAAGAALGAAGASAFPDDRDRSAHYALAARAYALWLDTDINLFFFFTHLYGDAFKYKPRAGASVSRIVGGALEVHAEALGQLGSARSYVNDICYLDLGALQTCAVQGRLLQTSRLTSRGVTVRALAGATYTFSNDALLAVEYLYNGDGYDTEAFQDVGRLLSVSALARQRGLSVPLPTASGGDPGSPQKFAVSYQRQHYVFLTFTQPRVLDDITLTGVVLLNAQDLSGVVAPQVVWSVRDWINLSLFAFGVFRGPERLRTPASLTLPTPVGPVTAGSKVSEFGVVPLDWRVLVSARVFY
jgi:hypothetical protein